MTNKNVIFNLALSSVILSAPLMATNRDMDKDISLSDDIIRSFLPELSEKQKILSYISEELTEFETTTVNTGSASLDYGNSINSITEFHLNILRRVKSIFDSTGARPQVLEIGPGNGYFSRFLVLAGADLTFIEKFEVPARETNERLNGELLELASFSLRGIVGDATDEEAFASIDPESFDIVFSFHVAHFFTPDQMQSCMHHSSDCLKEGGILAISSLAPINLGDKIHNFYCKNKSAGLTNPGYCLHNMINSRKGFGYVGDIMVPEEGHIPGENHKNFFNCEDGLEDHLRQQGFDCFHFVKNYFLPDDLEPILRKFDLNLVQSGLLMTLSKMSNYYVIAEKTTAVQ